MKIKLDLIGSPLAADPDAPERVVREARLSEREAALDQKRAVVREGWGAHRAHRKGKRTTWERIDRLVDPGTTPLTVGTLVNWDRDFPGSKRPAPGAGVVTAFGQVHGRWTMIIANDNTVASGAWWPLTPEKIERAQTMALKLKVPVVYLVDCSGLFLPEQARSFPGRTGAGHIFTMNARLSAAGVPQVAGVFGDCIAGGGYMPIISDRVYMTEQAYMVIAGAALIQGAKTLKLSSLDIGGPEVHVHQSACADVRVPDDDTCIAAIRAEVARLPSTAADFYRHGAEAESPLHSPAELPAVMPIDHRHVYDIRDVVGRLVDGSLFHEFMPHTGQEILTGVGRVGGLWVGFAANVLEPMPRPGGKGRRPGGILYREGIAKLSAFSRACNDDGIPLVWLQDIAGFDIGVEAESQGLLGYGSSLIYTNSTNTTPMFTVLLRKASGAGYYAMAGLPYEPVVQLSTTLSRQAVMEGRTLAIAAYNTKLDANFEIDARFSAEERAEIAAGMEKTAARIEADMDPVAAAARMDTDEVIRFDELRPWMVALAEMAYQPIGVRRIKNPRIWSLHDLAVLSRGIVGAPVEAVEAVEAAVGPEVSCDVPGAVPVRAPLEGAFWTRPSPKDPEFAPVGAVVAAGQTVGLVEVMKTFTPIKSPAAGAVVQWRLNDGDPIGEGEVLGWVAPATDA
jgi:acetyl-CoA carboxylase carboxyltransferase component/biotin carboxyl carrier protein